MRIGVDLGGTKIEAIAIDGSGRERGRRRVATPVGDYAGTIRAVAAVVQAIESECGAQGTIGVAIPGTMGLDLVTCPRPGNCNGIGRSPAR